jgi:hypothetical protein
VLLGTTAVIRLKSPLAHGGYSKTIKDAPWPLQQGEETGRRSDSRVCDPRRATSSSRNCCSRSERSPAVAPSRGHATGQKADTKDFTTVGHPGLVRQTGNSRGGPLHRLLRLCMKGDLCLWMTGSVSPLTEASRSIFPQAKGQLSSARSII